MANLLEAHLQETTLHLIVRTKRLDAAAASGFKRECEKVLTPAVRAVTVDLDSVEFVDSSGIGALLSIYKRLPAETARVRLEHVQPPVQSVLELLRLHRIFEVAA